MLEKAAKTMLKNCEAVKLFMFCRPSAAGVMLMRQMRMTVGACQSRGSCSTLEWYVCV
uniref:Uncharacterized protein n=1 Tax=Anopheles minimus TaxID=112268 RepID=A0A182WMY2_9DIPT